MATTHRLTPEQIAKRIVLEDPPLFVTTAGIAGLIEAGILAYTAESNQRPENLSEVCRRLLVNLHWVEGREITEGKEFEIYFGHRTPYGAYVTEAGTIEELEELAPIAQRAGVALWVKAAG